MTWRLKKSAAIRPIPAIRANHVFLAIDAVLPIVADSTMSLTMTTTPVFHGYDSIADNRVGLVSVTARQWAFAWIFDLEE